MANKEGGRDKKDKKDQLARSYSDFELLIRLLHYMRPHWLIFTIALFTMFLGALFSIAQPLVLLIAIDNYIVPGSVEGLVFIAILYFLINLASFLCLVIATYITTIKGLEIITQVRQDTFYKLQNLSMDYFDRESTGRIISRVTNDIERLMNLLSFGLIDAIVNSLFLVVLFVVMFYLDIPLTLVVLVIFPFILIFIVYFRVKSRKAWQSTRRTIAKLTGNYQEAISGIRVSKAFIAENYLTNEFDELNLENLQARLRALIIFAIMFPVMDVLFAISTALVLGVGGASVGGNMLTIGVLVAFLSYLSRLSQPIMTLSNFYNDFLAAMAASERIFDVLDRTPSVVPRDTKNLANVEGELVFQNVYFKYNEESAVVLKDFNLRVPPKSTVAFVGHTGAGKTTLTNILCRFYDFQDGSITLDGVDIRDISLENYRKWIAIIPQDSFLFSGTVHENLLYGNPRASDKEIEQALLKTGANNFVMRIGLDAEVGERGSHLSVGERQLLCFARALLANPKILILDEATSSIDAHTELIIQQSLQSILKDRTAIIIAHRLSTVRSADNIVVLEKGKIKEQGTFQELLDEKGIFANLYNKQFMNKE